uniref:Tetratricopeptide repeat domain 34 n=1 Tax=Echeneis naucrates TaxID=173247 RepID=A0A665T937_ECHNA
MTASQIKVSGLCEDGDKLLEAGELGRATSLYMSAFRTHAATTMLHMRKLEKSSMAGVISTLEGWLDNHRENRPAEGLNKGLAAVFLSTLCPNNLSATVFKMESLLQSGGHGCDEIFARCTALLEGKRSPRPEGLTRMVLEITRALACLFIEPHSIKGLRLYLQAYQSNKSDIVTLVKTRQAQHLSKIVKALTVQVLQMHPRLMLDFYSSLLHHGRCQKMSENSLDNSLQDSPERRARLLTGRAAAYFSAGGRIAEACQDLGGAFELHPATARIHFQKLFTDHGLGVAARSHLRQQAERVLCSYRERVLIRPDLRSSEGVELLDPAITQLRTLCLIEADGGGRELRVRLADCLLLRGEHKEALSICSQLAATQGQQSYQNTVQVLRGYARLMSDDHKGALEDFQSVIEHNAPHPSSCVRALCGRGLLRMMGGLNYLTALDYVTASRLHPQETALTIRCLVPWNCRGLLFTVLLEQGRVLLEGIGVHKSRSNGHSHQPQEEDQTPTGVHSLAVMLMELRPGTDGPEILAADALYQLCRVEEAYRLLLSVVPTSPRAPILARLALLQLHRGFLYDTNQLLKRLIQCGDTSCLRPLLEVAHQKDRALLQGHCHSAAKRILDVRREESAVREAVAYLSIAIMASGGEATDSLLERARCYARLSQQKTAIFDFSAILKEHPNHIQALCGRSFTYLMLNQKKECIHDILEALQINTDMVIKDILSLKDTARKLVCDWLHQYCQNSLSDVLVTNTVPCQEEQLRDYFVIGGALMKTDCRDPRWHLLYVDILFAKGKMEAAHLRQVFGQEPRDAVVQARVGVVEAWQQSYCSAARRLSKLAEKDAASLDFLLALIPFSQRKRMAQAAAQEASSVSSGGHWDQALTLLTTAVQAVDNQKLQYLRQRAACLAQLSLHERAVADLDRVIQKHSGSDPSCSDDPQVRAEDLCRRGRSLVLCSKEEAALEDFTRALELHREQTIQCVDAGLGKQCLAGCFLRRALQHYGEQQLSKAWTLIECGLTVDSENAELRRLRARVKREVASPCNVN